MIDGAVSNAVSGLLAESARLLGQVDEAMAQQFVPILDAAAARPVTGAATPFPLGPYPDLAPLASAETTAAIVQVAAADPFIGWGHPPEEFVPPGWAHGAAAATLLGPTGAIEGPDSDVFGLFYLSPGLDYADHWHDAEEFYLVLAGSAEWTVGDTTATYGPGDYTRTPSQAVHRIVTRDQPVLAIWGWSGDTSFDSYGY